VGKTGTRLLELMLAHLSLRCMSDPERHWRWKSGLAPTRGFWRLRRSDIFALKIVDLRCFDGPSAHLVIKIRQSKMDQAGQGASVLLNSGNSILLTAELIQDWVQYRHQMGSL